METLQGFDLTGLHKHFLPIITYFTNKAFELPTAHFEQFAVLFANYSCTIL